MLLGAAVMSKQIEIGVLRSSNCSGVSGLGPKSLRNLAGQSASGPLPACRRFRRGEFVDAAVLRDVQHFAGVIFPEGHYR
jgi:hypothetical protein